MRICTFLPSATEIVCALGLTDALFGVSHECDYPPEARTKPRVVRNRFDATDHTSQEIDRLVADMMSRGDHIYEVDVETLGRARPDLVITQDLCDVCAISFEDVQSAVLQLETPPRLISLGPGSLDDVMDDVRRVGEATGRIEQASSIIAGLKRRIEEVRSTVAGTAHRPRVACIEWVDPLMLAGHWMPEMVELAGGVDGLVRPGALSKKIALEELVDYDPEVLVLMPCGMDVDRAIREFSGLSDLGRWRAMLAVGQDRVYVVDSGSLFSRSGPRLVEGLELLSQIIHPELSPVPLPEGAGRRLDVLRITR